MDTWSEQKVVSRCRLRFVGSLFVSLPRLRISLFTNMAAGICVSGSTHTRVPQLQKAHFSYSFCTWTRLFATCLSRPSISVPQSSEDSKNVIFVGKKPPLLIQEPLSDKDRPVWLCSFSKKIPSNSIIFNKSFTVMDSVIKDGSN